MAAPAYVTDLTNIDTAEAIGTWVETGTWTAGTAPTLEPDFFIQQANCIAKYMTSGGVGVGGWVMNNGAGVTVPSPGAVFVWMNAQCPNNIDTEANGGLRVIIGNLSTAFYGWKVKGKDTYTYGGWGCYPVDPAVTPDYTVGAPTATKQWFGGAVSQLANAKGGTGIDVMRYGRGELKCEFGALADGYATFTGAAAVNDTIANRWGLCQAIDGGFLQQGLFLMGSATNAVDFRDSNKSVVIANTKKVVAAFNTFEVRNASSRVDWTNISITALGTVSKGTFVVTNNATVNKVGCVFTDMSTFAYLGASTIDKCTFRRCGKITQGGATFTGCVIDASTSTPAVEADAPGAVSNCTFISAGTGHAIEITTPGTYSFTGMAFTGYGGTAGSNGVANSGSTDAAVYNNSGGAVTINVSGGTTPAVRNGAGATTTVTSSVTLTLTGLVPGSDIVILDAGTTTERVNVDANGGTTYNFGFSVGGNVDICVFKATYVPFAIRNYALPVANGSVPIAQVLDRNYVP